jgi:MazG family protein
MRMESDAGGEGGAGGSGPGDTGGRGDGEVVPHGLGERFERLVGIMAGLRSPTDGCPWDLEQSAESLSRHILEEAYEAVEAIDSSDWGHLEEELGDLLLQIVFQSRIAEEAGRFDLAGVVDGISEKLERRHPHIFGSMQVSSAEQVSLNWDRIKREQEGGEQDGALKVPTGLPAMLAALKLQGQAARVGFDWTAGDDVFQKLDEETRELWDARLGPVGEREKELGDLLFTVINVARHLGVEPERALRSSCAEFAKRFNRMEELASAAGEDLSTLSLERMDELWEKAKLEEAEGTPRGGAKDERDN